MAPSNSENIIRELNLPKEVFLWNVHNFMVISPGEKIKIFWSEKKDSIATHKFMVELMQHINIVFSYTSVYQEEKWGTSINNQGINNISDEWFPQIDKFIKRKNK